MIWPRCREVSRLIAEGAYDEAPAARRLLARLHLLICAHCRRFRRELALLGEAVRAWSGGLPGPREGLETRVLARLRR